MIFEKECLDFQTMVVLLSTFLVNLNYQSHLAQPTVDLIHANMKSFIKKLLISLKVSTFEIIDGCFRDFKFSHFVNYIIS